jgi:opacity protein-like surface antigen
MKNIKLSLVALMAMSSLSFAGGDFSVVTPYEVEDAVMAEEAYVEPEIVEAYVAPKVEVIPEPVALPVVVAPKVEPVIPTPIPVPVKNISANGFYAGLGIAGARYSTSCKGCSKSGEDKTAGLMARVGYDFNKYIGLEARGIKTNWKSDGGKVEHAGVFVKPMIPVGDATNVYGLVGVAKTKTKGSLQKTNSKALALGAGVEVDLSTDTPKDGRYGRSFDGKGDQEKGIGVFVDYERMVVKSSAPHLDAVSAGVTYDF